jgi:type 1 glutamine amidotransferase
MTKIKVKSKRRDLEMTTLLISKVAGTWVGGPGNTGGITYTVKAINGSQPAAPG